MVRASEKEPGEQRVNFGGGAAGRGIPRARSRTWHERGHGGFSPFLNAAVVLGITNPTMLVLGSRSA